MVVQRRLAGIFICKTEVTHICCITHSHTRSNLVSQGLNIAVGLLLSQQGAFCYLSAFTPIVSLLQEMTAPPGRRSNVTCCMKKGQETHVPRLYLALSLSSSLAPRRRVDPASLSCDSGARSDRMTTRLEPSRLEIRDDLSNKRDSDFPHMQHGGQAE